jgi:hypothetical protein
MKVKILSGGKMKRLIAAAGAFVLSATTLLGVLSPVGAQQGTSNGFLVSPVRSELTIDPGKSETVKLTIENATNSPTIARPIVNDFEPSKDESGQPKILLDENAPASGNSFRSLVGNLQPVPLGPKEKKDIDVKIAVPGSASAGGYYGAVRFVSEQAGNDKNVALSASVGTIFLIRVPGNLTEKLDLVQFTAAKNGSNGKFFMNSGNMSIVTRLKNNGNIHVKPYGKVTVTDRGGKTVEAYEFNSTDPRSNVLPNSTRKFDDKLKNTKWFGQYTVTANFGYGSGGSLITAKTTFWVIPTWVIIILAIIVLGLVVAGFMIYRKFAVKTHRPVRPRR